MSGARAGPLDCIAIVDLSQNLAGPYCTQLLGDLGASVIKVEPPAGDAARAWGPPFRDGESTIFLSANRNKRSIALDLKDARGAEVLARLVARADVFVQSARAGAIEALGFGPAVLCARDPRLIYCSITAYGARGPLHELPGYDPLMQAHGGIMSVTGQPGAPVRVGTSMVDMGTGLWAAIGILSALRQRDATGRGAHVVASLYETTLAWSAYHLLGHLATGDVPGPSGTGFPQIAPYGAFPTTDGRLMITAANDGLFRRLCDALGLVAERDDPAFATNPLRVARRIELEERVARATRRHETAGLIRILREAGVPCAPIQDMAQVASDPQTAASELIVDAAGPTVLPPLAWDGERTAERRPPPRLGEHTEDVLRELGYDAQQRANLLRDCVAGTAAIKPPAGC